jgi:tetratricopeptide (TPR) repeat protein
VSKKPTKTRQITRIRETAKPGPTQLTAVQRLLDARDYPRAIERARALVDRFPDHDSTNALLLRVLEEAGRSSEALLAAWNWASHRPRNVSALQAVVTCALGGGCPALAFRAAEQLAELGVVVSSAPLDPARLEDLVRNPDGSPMGRDEAERFETGKLHLEAGDFAGVLRTSKGANSTPGRNNLALALFHLGRIQEARDAFLGAWQQDPGNLFGLSGALAMRLYLGDETGAAGLAVPLAQAEPRRIEDAHGQLQGLLLIGEDQAAWDAFQRARAADWAALESTYLVPEWLQLGGGAAARVGAEQEARTLWRRALRHKPNLAAAAENLAARKESDQTHDCPALFELHQMIPYEWINCLRDTQPGNLGVRLATLTASNAYLKAVYLGGVRDLRQLAGIGLSHRLKPGPGAVPPGRGSAGAAAALRDLIRRPVGTHDERGRLLQALRDAGLIGPSEEVDYWNGKAITRIQVISTEVYREAEPEDLVEDLPDDLQPLFDESVELLHQQRLEAAEQRIQAILARVSDHPRALGNLATIRARQGRRGDCVEILRRIIATHPDYLMARCNLATLLVEDGEIKAAKDAIDGLIRRPRMHIEDHFSLQGVMAMLAQAQGESEAADRIIAALQSMVQTDADKRMLAVAQARVARAKGNSSLLDALRSLLARGRRN